MKQLRIGLLSKKRGNFAIQEKFTGADGVVDETGAEVTVFVHLCKEDAEVMKALDGDLVYIADKRWWLGGLRSLHATLKIDECDAGSVIVPKGGIESARLRVGEEVVVEKII